MAGAFVTCEGAHQRGAALILETQLPMLMKTNQNSPRINLLLVDAEHDYFAMVMLLLEEIAPRKFLLQWASTYSFAVSLVRRHQFVLCLSNVRIGHRTGTELLLDMRARGCMTPVILLASGEEMMDSGAPNAMDHLDRNRLTAAMLRQALRDAGCRPEGGVQFHPGLGSPLATAVGCAAA